MVEQNDLSRIEQLIQMIRPGCALLRAWRLDGGVSAQVMAFEIEQPDGRTERMVLRRHGIADRTRNPDIALDEYRLLTFLDDAGLAVPEPIDTGPTGTIFPTPYIITEFVDGATLVAPSDQANAIEQMATFLTRLHTMRWAKRDLSFLPDLEERVGDILQRPAANAHAEWVREALVAHWPLTEPNTRVLLHGDFWPGNVMWKDGQLAAVIDWEDAAIGDPLADLANCRLELLWMFGADAMRAFTDRYTLVTSTDVTNLPFWELYAALGPASKLAEWGLDPDTERKMRAKLNDFADQARIMLSTRSGKL